MEPLRIAFDRQLPVARWGPFFHVLCLERPDVRLEWRPTGFPTPERSLLEGADVGVFVEPPPEPRTRTLTVERSQMVVTMAVGHPLARQAELSVDDILDQPFPGGRHLHPGWASFWTLDAYRGGPPECAGGRVEDAGDGLAAVVSGRAIATLPATLADGLPHLGLIAVPLTDGPPVATRLVWRADEANPLVDLLVDLVRRMTGDLDGNGGPPVSGVS